VGWSAGSGVRWIPLMVVVSMRTHWAVPNLVVVVVVVVGGWVDGGIAMTGHTN